MTLMVGGKRDNIFSKPVPLRAVVRNIVEAKALIEGPVNRGAEIDLGQTVVLQTGQIFVVLTKTVYPGHDPSLYRCVGLQPEEAQMIVAKSSIHYRANYASIAKEFIVIDTPGMSTSNFTFLPFKNVPRPFFPLDMDAEIGF